MTKSKSRPQPSSTYPSLHPSVANAVSSEIGSTWFHARGNDNDALKNYSTYIMGKFKCLNRNCSQDGWGSKKVFVLIRGYPNNGYDALVFNQRCETCKCLGALSIDQESYVERVSYWLKKWAGAYTEPAEYSSKEGLPHKTELCEGCKRGYCQRRSD